VALPSAALHHASRITHSSPLIPIITASLPHPHHHLPSAALANGSPTRPSNSAQLLSKEPSAASVAECFEVSSCSSLPSACNAASDTCAAEALARLSDFGEHRIDAGHTHLSMRLPSNMDLREPASA
jgi:hypothetical protein